MGCAYNWRKGGTRQLSYNQNGAGRRMGSPADARWAYSRNRKLSLGDGRFDVVESWVLKGRDAQGKVYVEHGDAYESDAKAWVETGDYRKTVSD